MLQVMSKSSAIYITQHLPVTPPPSSQCKIMKMGDLKPSDLLQVEQYRPGIPRAAQNDAILSFLILKVDCVDLASHRFDFRVQIITASGVNELSNFWRYKYRTVSSFIFDNGRVADIIRNGQLVKKFTTLDGVCEFKRS